MAMEDGKAARGASGPNQGGENSDQRLSDAFSRHDKFRSELRLY